MRARLSILTAALLAACGGGTGPSVEPPSSLTYATNPAVYTADVAITANTPSSSGGAVASYSVSPSLPARLGLNTTTGVISGTPTTATATATYTVTASNSAGSTTVALVITVSGAPWYSRAPLPIPRADHALVSPVSPGRYLYALGGYSGSTLALVDRYDEFSNAWTRVAPMQTARREFAAGVINGKIYVACGMSWSNGDAVTYVTTTEAYDPATDTWSTLAPCPMDPPVNSVYGNVHIGGTVANGRLYVIQFNTNSPGGFTTMHAYDPGTNTWAAKSPPPFNYAPYSVAELGGSLYLVASYPSQPSAMPQTVESRLARYDSINDIWVVGPSLAGITSPSVTGFNGRLYAVGGAKLISGTMTVVTDVNQYDPTTNTWSSSAPVGVARYRAAAAVLVTGYDNELFFVGGSTPFDWNTVTPTTLVEWERVP